MQSVLNFHLLAYAAALPDLNLEADEQEEYSTMLLWLQNQVEGGMPNQTFVDPIPSMAGAVHHQNLVASSRKCCLAAG